MSDEQWLQQQLSELEELGRLRRLRRRALGDQLLDFSSNDYLGLRNHPRLIESFQTAVQQHGVGAGASRLISGNFSIHEDLEQRLAEFKGYPAALVFGAGYLANLGALSALLSRHDTAVSDRLAHASLIDGVKLSGAKHLRYRHNDLQHLRQILQKAQSERKASSRLLVLTESVFSMDGDTAPLSLIAELCREFEAMLLVDEAHAFGIYGPNGSGLVSAEKLQSEVAICTGNFSKACGSYGGFVVCSQEMRDYLLNSARPFIYNTALPPALAQSALTALEMFAENPNWGQQLLARANLFRQELLNSGFSLIPSTGAIVPLIVGDSQRAVSFSERLLERGVFAPAIRPPTVPLGTERLRFTVSLAHNEEAIVRAAQIIASVGREEGLL